MYTKMILTFPNQLIINPPSLVYRGCRMNMIIMVYKIIHALDGSPLTCFLCTMTVPTISNGYKLFSQEVIVIQESIYL